MQLPREGGSFNCSFSPVSSAFVRASQISEVVLIVSENGVNFCWAGIN
ncbi:MAG: hypothetical protein ACXAES_10585 [Promethearchaeota archaeon]